MHWVTYWCFSSSEVYLQGLLLVGYGSLAKDGEINIFFNKILIDTEEEDSCVHYMNSYNRRRIKLLLTKLN